MSFATMSRCGLRVGLLGPKRQNKIFQILIRDDRENVSFCKLFLDVKDTFATQYIVMTCHLLLSNVLSVHIIFIIYYFIL